MSSSNTTTPTTTSDPPSNSTDTGTTSGTTSGDTTGSGNTTTTDPSTGGGNTADGSTTTTPPPTGSVDDNEDDECDVRTHRPHCEHPFWRPYMDTMCNEDWWLWVCCVIIMISIIAFFIYLVRTLAARSRSDIASPRLGARFRSPQRSASIPPIYYADA